MLLCLAKERRFFFPWASLPFPRSTPSLFPPEAGCSSPPAAHQEDQARILLRRESLFFPPQRCPPLSSLSQIQNRAVLRPSGGRNDRIFLPKPGRPPPGPLFPSKYQFPRPSSWSLFKKETCSDCHPCQRPVYLDSVQQKSTPPTSRKSFLPERCTPFRGSPPPPP